MHFENILSLNNSHTFKYNSISIHHQINTTLPMQLNSNSNLSKMIQQATKVVSSIDYFIKSYTIATYMQHINAQGRIN